MRDEMLARLKEFYDAKEINSECIDIAMRNLQMLLDLQRTLEGGIKDLEKNLFILELQNDLFDSLEEIKFEDDEEGFI
jgi:hypothetical protein